MKIPHQTHLVVWGLPSCGKDFLSHLIRQRLRHVHIFGMGDEFRAVKNQPGRFDPEVEKFVLEDMPRGELAPIHVYRPVFDAAWQRQRKEIRAARLNVFNGVVRTEEQWKYFRGRLCEDTDHTHRVIVVWLDRPEEICLDLWRERLAQSQEVRPDDAAGQDVFHGRVARALEHWDPICRHLQNGSSADFVRFQVSGNRMESGFENLLRALELEVPRPSHESGVRVPTHDLLRVAAAPQVGPPRLRLEVCAA